MEIYIYQARETMGNKYISLRELQERTGISRNRIQEIETGKKSPKLDELERICEALGVYMEDLYYSEKSVNLYYSKFSNKKK
ncbi:helix-turn-helix domain-containing protein [Velocimicrobium porci]|uniref:Helix-turn-helix transcriptional regulator n=1 Tax=Velocimicrobium porci TaxID=2606634 RepID=A0A6L5XWN0_9FIRM|nr:helix-turn-helix transcriptional regulator [Velocimicrobium porci]MSS63152.1 helix-turn-helix transcriptional regulator [Velocimicrobium porci]